MDTFASLVYFLKGIIWSFPCLLALLSIGVYYTYVLKGIQFRYLFYGLKVVLTEKDDKKSKGDISQFEALMTTLAAAIGTGNIAGVAVALTLGGMGALFWMWVTAIVGMAIKYAEALLSVKYRITDKNGEMSGGPMYTLERGLKSKGLATAFAVIGMFAATGAGNLIQSNSVADSIVLIVDINQWYVGVILSILTGFVLLGGVKSIGKVASFLVPAMAIFYLTAGLYILFVHASLIPGVLQEIVYSAFSGEAALGGFMGTSVMLALQTGVSQAVFASEVGLGTTVIADAAAKTEAPAKQALISMTGTFLSVIVVCTITGLVIGVTGSLGLRTASGDLLTAAPLAIHAFDSVIPYGKYFVIIGLVLFAYSTIIAWSYYGEKCCEYLFGERWIRAYRLFFTLLLIPGAAIDLHLVWALANTMNGLMAIPNLIGVVGLRKVVREEAQAYLAQLKK